MKNLHLLLVRRLELLSKRLSKYLGDYVSDDDDIIVSIINFELDNKKDLLRNDIIPLDCTVIDNYKSLSNNDQELSEYYSLLKRYLELYIICDYNQAYIYKDMIVNMLGLDDEYEILDLFNFKGEVRLLG